MSFFYCFFFSNVLTTKSNTKSKQIKTVGSSDGTEYSDNHAQWVTAHIWEINKTTYTLKHTI